MSMTAQVRSIPHLRLNPLSEIVTVGRDSLLLREVSGKRGCVESVSDTLTASTAATSILLETSRLRDGILPNPMSGKHVVSLHSASLVAYFQRSFFYQCQISCTPTPREETKCLSQPFHGSNRRDPRGALLIDASSSCSAERRRCTRMAIL